MNCGPNNAWHNQRNIVTETLLRKINVMKKYLFLLLMAFPACFVSAQNKWDKEPYLVKSLSSESIKNIEAKTSGGSILVKSEQSIYLFTCLYFISHRWFRRHRRSLLRCVCFYGRVICRIVLCKTIHADKQSACQQKQGSFCLYHIRINFFEGGKINF